MPGLKIGTTKRGIGPAYEDKVGRRAIRVVDLADLDALPAKIERLLAHHNALRRGLGIDEVDAERAARRADGDRARRSCPMPTRSGRCSTRSAGPASASCSRARRARCSTSTTAPIPFVTSSNTVAGQAATGSGLGPRRDRLRARHRQGLHDPRRRGPVPDRAVRRDRRDASASAAASSASSPGASAAAAGSTRCWCARRCGPPASTASR